MVTTTYFDDGKTETRWLGFTHLDIRSPSGDEAGPVATRLRSLGILVGTESGIGYFDDSYVRIPFDCRIVFLVQTEAQLLEAKRMIDDQPDKGYSCATRY
ncbi:hypothetical protein PQQ51_11320 [Paraburkholderia xenovorans]|uniref:hypothetical protein n=1 Tax=Paraburkholderia xenovorans TaxID=36873 RepID=UPI0038B8B61E